MSASKAPIRPSQPTLASQPPAPRSLRPIQLRPDNFTPPQRTPWGGPRLLGVHKAALNLPYPAGTSVGESWELSAGVELPSYASSGERLADLLSAEPIAMLGHEAERGRMTTALVVKWLDAGDDLSLQIHPEDGAPGLAAGEGGKVEAWYVIAHEPGARVYLGFRDRCDEAQVRRALERGDDLSGLMAQRPVHVGDLILLEPGTPHAVGRGITLLEPQHVEPGKRALTYRYWDWNRRFDANGSPNSLGAPRKLHVAQALAATNWGRATSPAWLATRCRGFGAADLRGAARIDALCGPESSAAISSTHLRVTRLSGNGMIALPDWAALRSITAIDGTLTLGEGKSALVVASGTTAAIPAACGPLAVKLESAHALVCAVAS